MREHLFPRLVRGPLIHNRASVPRASPLVLGPVGMVVAIFLTNMTSTITPTISKPRTRPHRLRHVAGKGQAHPSGTPRPGGRLARFKAGMDPNNRAIFEDGLAYVSVEGQGPRRAVLGEKDFLRITARDPSGPWLTKSRWWLDDDGMLRAYSLHEKPMEHGVLVAAAVIGAEAGETLDIPGDPLDVRRSQIRKLPAA